MRTHFSPRRADLLSAVGSVLLAVLGLVVAVCRAAWLALVARLAARGQRADRARRPAQLLLSAPPRPLLLPAPVRVSQPHERGRRP